MIAWLVLLQATLAISVSGPATSPEYLPLHVASAEGYFAEEKLSVTLQTARAEATPAQALSRGQVAVAATSLDAALQLGHAAGAPPRLVFGLTAAPPVVLLVPAALKDTIRSVRDLAGKTIGITAPGTPGEFALSSLLARAKLRADQVSVQSFGERGVVGALESATVAAAVVADPWATRLIDEGKAAALIDLRRLSESVHWLGEPTVHAALFAGADTKLGAAELTPLCRALLRALARIRVATAEDLEAQLPRAVVGTPEDFALRLRGARESFLLDGWVTTDMLGASLDFIRARGPISAKVDIPFRLSKLLLLGPLGEALGRRP